MNKFFSVIIPTYNRKDFLERSINSVLNQSFKDYELLVVDDGSSDGTKEYLEKKGISFLSVGEQGVPVGVSKARNVGVSQTKGEWICFLDSDDEWLEDKLEKQHQFILENPEFKLVHGEERWVRNGVRVNQMKKHQKGGGDQFFRSLELCVISPSTVCLKRELYDLHKGFREDFSVCEDYDLWLKITSSEKIGFIEDELIIKYGGHEDQLSRKFKAMDYFRVKSIDWCLENLALNESQREESISVLKRKSEILMKGYQKHQNLDNFDEVHYIYKKYTLGV